MSNPLMHSRFYPYFKAISKGFSVNMLAKISGQNLVLPFYHTVSDDPEPHFSESSYFRTENQFVDDLDFFIRNFGDLQAGKFGGSRKQFHLSFDDGMSEIYDVVFPLLQRRKISATFFINTDFVDNKNLFISHKKSLIQCEIKSSKHYLETVSAFFNTDENLVLKQVAAISSEAEIDEIAHRIQLNFTDYLHEKKPYLTTAQITELKSAGFTIGNHGRSHQNFNTLNFESQKAEIEAVNIFLKETGISEIFFAFPYGDQKIKNELFEWMYSDGEISKSFGVSGLKKDGFSHHHHRILMEQNSFSAEEIIKAEYFYYLLKSFFFKNKIRR